MVPAGPIGDILIRPDLSLLAHITRKSVEAPAPKPCMRVYAQVNSVAALYWPRRRKKDAVNDARWEKIKGVLPLAAFGMA